VGTLSGGERQALAIGRAVYFGARVLVLDEPTAALGVRESATVLRLIERVRAKGVAVLFITHNAYHAYAAGDRFMVLRRGTTLASFAKNERSIGEVIELMAGGAELQSLLTASETSLAGAGPAA
jgi:simple sugar transport system ATP-binding protein